MSSPGTSTILANLSPSLFQAGPKDVTATPDIYNVNSSQLNGNQNINTNVGKFNPTDGSLVNNLMSGASGILSSITTAIGLATALSNPASLTNPATIARLGSAAGIPTNAMTTALTVALGTSVNLNANNYNTLQVSGQSGYNTTIQTSDVATAQSVLSIVNSMSGNSSLVTLTDTGAEATVASTVTGQLIGLGLSSTVSDFIATQPSTVQTAALTQNVMTAIENSDLTTLQLCITTLGVGGVLNQVPNAALLLLQEYQIPTGAQASGYAALWTTLLRILETLAPSWMTTTFGGTTYNSLTYFQAASADVITLMETSNDETIVQGAAIASGFQTENALTALQQMYPSMLVVKSSSAT